MSTELFRKYIDILKEGSEEVVISSDITDLDRLTVALTQLETVLDKYRDSIREDQATRAQNQLFEVFSPEELAALQRAADPGAPPIDLSRMSREQIEALRNGTAAGSTPPTPPAAGNPISRFVSNNPTIQKIRATSGRDLAKSGIKKLGHAGAIGFAAYEVLSHLANWFTKNEFKNLAPVDQRIIKNNIPIIQPWTAPDKLKTLDPNLRLRLLHVVDLLNKLGMSLRDQSSAMQNEEVDDAQQPNQELFNLIDKAYADISESDQMAMKRFVLQNMHLLSEAEQMAVRRDMLSEIDWTDAAMIGGGVFGAPGVLTWIRNWFLARGQDWAKEASAEEIAQKIAEIEEENRITKIQNDNAERTWKTQNARQLRTGGKALDKPEPKALKELPKMPKVPKQNWIQKVGSGIVKQAVKRPIIAALVGAAGAAGGYTLMYTGAAVKGMDVVDNTIKEKMVELKSAEEMFKEAAKMTDAHLAGLLTLDPGRLLEYFKVEMNYCSAFPDYPTCQERMKKICSDPGIKALNGGVALDGC
jgi:hypothetical protein